VVQRTVSADPSGISSATEMPAAELPTMTSSPSAVPRPDVTTLAEQVYTLIVRRLAHERERRGW
jgi:hypothetical protein